MAISETTRSVHTSETSPQPGFLLRQVKKLSLELVVLAVIFILCLWLLFWVADMVFENHNTRFDDHVFELIVPYINPGNTAFMEFITFFGSHLFLLPANIALAGIFLFIKKYRWYSVKIAAVALTSTAVMFLLKEILKRQRPMLPLISKVHGYSFPSGHSFSSLVFFGMLGYIVHRTIRNKLLKWSLILCCAAAVLLIGFSRIYLKLHFASDVIAGFCLGIIWLLLARWLLVKTEKIADAGVKAL